MRAVPAPRSAAATFFGRAEELAAADALLRGGARLITLHGAPGVGKSRLLRELAARWRGEGRRVFQGALGGARGREDVLAAIARAIGEEPRARDPRRLIDRLRARLDEGPAVLLLDEVERAADAVAEVAGDLVDATEELTLVLASRERLGISAEVLLPLRGLDEDAAMELLRDRLLRLSPARVDEAIARRLVRALDGLPLAIELAAARARVTGLAALVRAVAHDPGEGFGRADLRRLVQSSWDALSAEAREGLALVSVFRGAFDAAAAAALLAPSSRSPPMDILQELADASLVEIGEDGSGARFLVLGVVRAFAAERLDASDSAPLARARHADHFARLAGIDDAALWARAGSDRENLLAAWRTLTTIDQPRSARLALAIDPLLVTQGPPSLHREVLASALAIARAEDDPRLRAELLRARGRSAGLSGHHGEALRDFREAMELATLAGDDALVGWLAAFLCFSLRAVGDVDEARAQGLAALAVARRREDPRLEAMSEQALGLVAVASGDVRAGILHQRRAAASAATGDAPRLEGIAEANLAAALISLGDFAIAERALARSRACLTAIGDRYHIASIAPCEAQVMRARGEHEAAERHLTAALAVIQEVDDLGGEIEARAELARLADARGDRELARRRLDEARALARRTDDRSRAAELESLEILLAEGHAAPAPLLVAADARSFTLAGRTVDLSRRGALRRVLAALLRARHERPGEALDVHAVLLAGWPGERMHPDSGAARVYMAIRRLRSLGLESAIQTRDDGYLLDPAFPVRLDDRDC
jgi:predicted ATPase